MSDGYVYDVYSSNFTFYNEMLSFKNNLVLPNVLGNKFYKFTDPQSPQIIDITGADFSEILDSYNDSDKTFTEMSNVDAGMSNRYNTFANVNDNYLYGIGGNKKIYVSTNLSNWLEVADFSTVDSGAEPITIAYWPNTNRIIVATAGQNGGIYYIDHSDVLNGVVSRINNLTSLDFIFENESVDLKTTGTSVTNLGVLIKDGSLYLSRISASFTSGNLDWTGVTGDSDLTLGKSVVSNLTSAPGADSTHTLFVPIPADNPGLQVLVCPNATNLTDVNYDCSGGVLMSNGETKLVGSVNVTATKVTLDSQQYWSLEGVNGTGAYAYVPPPEPDPDPVSYPTSYPEPDPEPNQGGNNGQGNQQNNTNNPIIYSPTIPITNKDTIKTISVSSKAENIVSYVSGPIVPVNTNESNPDNQDQSQQPEESNSNLLWIVLIISGIVLTYVVLKRRNQNI